MSVAALCLAAAIYFFVTRDHPFVGLHWQMWRALGISLEERQDLYTAGFAVLALACLIWVLIGSRVARRVVITSAGVTIYSAQLGRSNRLVIPFAAIRDAGQRELASRSGRSDLARRADRIFHFSVNGRDFDFRRFAFQSDHDFERFCQLIVNRVGLYRPEA
ncbi:hypothetical protein PQQ99_03080 [Paraburkholderia sediminicola]|uniref:hypothetical protein n=1 Tax=Paraburkholderia sediminicola TaxID=458836 RepID=UPI0038B7C326